MRMLYLDLDTLRPDHLGCYGYHRDTSPNIDRIAAEGTTFTRYYTSDAPCLPSRAAMMSGRFGIHTGAVGHGGTNADMRLEGRGRGFKNRLSFDTLPAYLNRQAGMHTCYIGGFGDRHSLFTFYAGFREIHDTGKGGMESAEEVTPAVLDWMDANAKKDDWYLHVNYWDPHTPYRAPAEFGNPFVGVPLPAWLTAETIEKQKRETVGPHGVAELNMFDADTSPKFPRQPGKIDDLDGARAVVDGYDCGIRYMDGHIGKLLDALERNGVLSDTVIVVSADHGENQGELGLWAEHGSADEITCRIPMIVRWPGMTSGGKDDGLHYNLDLLPTLADLLGGPRRDTWDGESFAEALRSGADAGRDELILSQCCHGCQRAVRWDRWLYIRTYHDFFHLYPKEMLFDIESDPHEERDIASERPDLCREAVHRYLEWHDGMMETMPEGYLHDPLWEVIAEGGPFHAKGMLPKYVERLKSTGRAEAAEELVRRHPEEFAAKALR